MNAAAPGRAREPCSYAFRARLWLVPGVKAPWHFVTLPRGQARLIRARHGGAARSWGSLPVAATIGGSRWQTSLFPDRKAGAYLLPVKAGVRAREGIAAGDLVAVRIDLRA